MRHVPWHNKQSHRIKWYNHHIKWHDMTWHDMTCHVTTSHHSSPHVTSQPTALLHLPLQATSWHQNRPHYHSGTAESSFTAKTWFGHGAGRSPCAHSIGKFFLCYTALFSSETSAPGSPGNYLYLTLLLLDSSIIRLFYYLTLLLVDSSIAYLF